MGLKCDWAPFVLLALALDVDPYGGGLQELKRDHSESSERDLNSPASENVMAASKKEGSSLQG